jgi:ketosteroid isomerase-like protein
MSRSLIAIAVLAVAASSACRSRASDDEAVRAASRAWDRAHNAGDAAALGRLYAENAVSMPNNRPALEGRLAIEDDFRSFFKDVAATHATTIVSLEISGDLAVERGRYELSSTAKAGGPPTIERGKHIVVRRRLPDGWKIAWEIWNTD